MTALRQFIFRNAATIAPGKVYVAPDIPQDKLNSAIEGHRFSGAPDSILALYDDTVLGGGEDGGLFTDTHFSYRAMWSAPVCIAYADIAAASLSRGTLRDTLELTGPSGEQISLENLDNDDSSGLATFLLSCADLARRAAVVVQPSPQPAPAPAPAGGTKAEAGAETEEDPDDGISLGGLLAGAVVGVLAVAAAPFTGGGSVLAGVSLAGSLAGAGGIAAAVGAVGAVAGAGVAEHNRQQTAAARAARERMAADYALKTAALQDAYAKAATRFEEHNDYNQLILCLIAVGASMAACDGPTRSGEIEQLREFSLGLLNTRLPPTVEKAVSSLIAAPPPFDQAMTYVDRLGPDVWPMIDAVLEVVGEADGTLTAAEQTFLAQWAAYKQDKQNKQDLPNEAVAS